LQQQMMQLKFGQQQKLMDLLSQHHGTNVQNGQDTDFTSYMESPDFMSQVTAMGALDPEMLKLAEAIRQNKQARLTAQTSEQELALKAHPIIPPSETRGQQIWDSTKGAYVEQPGTQLKPQSMIDLEQQLNQAKVAHENASTNLDQVTADMKRLEYQAKPQNMADGLNQLTGIFAPGTAGYAQYAPQIQAAGDNPARLDPILTQAREQKKALAVQAAGESQRIAGELQVENFRTGGSDPFVQNVASADRENVRQAASKAYDTAVTAYSKTAQMDSLIALAKAGNKVAFTWIPAKGVMELSSGGTGLRITQAEIGMIAGAGSLWDSIKARMGKLATGQSVPMDILEDTKRLSDMVKDTTGQAYTQTVTGLNQLRHSTFPTTVESTFRPVGAPAVNPYAVTPSGGNPYR
jgi:hypothetical protein